MLLPQLILPEHAADAHQDFIPAAEWRALGFVVLCPDESSRFLALAAADLHEDAIDVASALLLLEDVEFYRDRSRSLRDVLGGELRDLLVAPDGSVEALAAEQSERVSTA